MNNNHSLGIALLDMGNHFSIVNSNTDYDFICGTFALTFININHEQFKKAITNIIHQYFNNGFQADNTEAFIASLSHKVDFHISHASKSYLPTKQSHMVTNLFVIEILNKITSLHFEIIDIEQCLPIILTNPKVHDDIKEILLRNSNDLTPIMQKTDTFEINAQLLNMSIPTYYLNSITDYLLLDLKMYLERSNKTVKECLCCNRLFLPNRKSDKYCRLPRVDRKTCNNIMHISPNDEFAKERNKARDKQHKQIRYYINTKNIKKHFY